MGLIGASEGGIISKGEGGSDQDVVSGAVLGLFMGAGSEVLMPVFNSLGRRLVKKFRGKNVDTVVTPDGQPTKEFIDALEESDTNIDEFIETVQREAGDPASNKIRQKAFEDLGAEATEAQRTRDTDLFVQQQDAFRRGGPVKTALENQEEIFDRGTRSVIADTGGVPQRAPASPIEAITKKATQLDAEVSELYKLARENTPKADFIRFPQTSKLLKTKNPLDKRSEGTVSALANEMKRLGFLDKNGNPTNLTSVEAAENMRQFANSLFEGANPLARKIIRKFKDSLDDDTFKSVDNVFKNRKKVAEDIEIFLHELKTTDRSRFTFKEINQSINNRLSRDGLSTDDFNIDFENLTVSPVVDMEPNRFFKEARKAKENFEKGLSKEARNKFDTRKVSLVRDILDNTVTEDELVTKVLRGSSKYKANDLRELRTYLTSGSPERS
jgi:hypothetical protein